MPTPTIETDVLAICTPRQSATFLRDACGLIKCTRIEVEDAPTEDAVLAHIDAITRWARTHPEGFTIATSDTPSVLHALAAQQHPDLPALRGACLKPILATVDKVWARHRVVGDLGTLPATVMFADQTQIPTFEGEDGGAPAIVKPVDACASIGIQIARTGDTISLERAPSGWLRTLRREEVGIDDVYDRAAATVEAYVAPQVPRVSVDGWIGADGTPHPIAISDNVYVDAEPERFDHQMFPTRLSPATQAACWSLWEAIAQRLHEMYGLHTQCFDVEMFAFEPEDGRPPRAEVMEINCRLHPNITPVLRRCLDGPDPLTAYTQDEWVEPEMAGAGGMFYVWTRGEAPRFERLDAEDDALIVCPFTSAGQQSNGRTCWGWIYAFGEDRQEVLARGRAALGALDAR